MTRLLAVLALALLAGCGGTDGGPRWIALDRLAQVSPIGEHEFALEGTGRRARLVREGEDRWLETTLEAADWTPASESGTFQALLAVLAIGQPRSGSPYRLETPAGSSTYEPDLQRFLQGSVAGAGTFTTNLVALIVRLGPGAGPPEHSRLMACANYEGSAALPAGDERAAGARLRIQGRRMSGHGFWTPAGEARAIATELPAGSRLRFATVVEAAQGHRDAREAPHTFRVRLDGATIFEHRQEGSILGESCARHDVELPRGGGRRMRLSFECDGPFAYASFLSPGIGPREVGAPGQRPGELERPDLFVFLADTFRADNLSAYGGEHGLAPNLDGFAEAGRTFLNAWSTSTHTLPAHSSMFSGVYPHQNGQVDYWNPLPGAVQTVAEILTDRGYRCGAITDGLMVSRSHGLDQGFEWFDERREEPLLARVRPFLEADDGRPVFLFVQTYAVHTPYAPSASTRERLGARLHLERSYEEVYRELEALGNRPGPIPAPPELIGRLRDLYLAAVFDLDQLFAGLRSELDSRGWLASGYLIFTSDHGEAFFEHGRPFHANKVFEEELRVPLVIQGPGVERGRESRPASLVDLAPTLVELAGIAPREDWEGRSLLAGGPERALFAFQSRRVDPESTLAVIEGRRKLIGFDDLEAVRAGKLFAAFDLESDPLERSNLLGSETWPLERMQAYRSRLERLLTPLVASERLKPTGQELLELQHMGYGGR